MIQPPQTKHSPVSFISLDSLFLSSLLELLKAPSLFATTKFNHSQLQFLQFNKLYNLKFIRQTLSFKEQLLCTAHNVDFGVYSKDTATEAGWGIKPPTLQFTCSSNWSQATTLGSWSNLSVNLPSAGAGHLTDARSVLQGSLRPVLCGAPSAELFLPLLLPDPSPSSLFHFSCLPADTDRLQTLSFYSPLDFIQMTSMNSPKLPVIVSGFLQFLTAFLRGIFFPSIHKSRPGSSYPLLLSYSTSLLSSVTVMSTPEPGVVRSVYDSSLCLFVARRFESNKSSQPLIPCF